MSESSLDQVASVSADFVAPIDKDIDTRRQGNITGMRHTIRNTESFAAHPYELIQVLKIDETDFLRPRAFLHKLSDVEKHLVIYRDLTYDLFNMKDWEKSIQQDLEDKDREESEKVHESTVRKEGEIRWPSSKKIAGWLAGK